MLSYHDDEDFSFEPAPRDELFEEMEKFVRGIDLSWGWGDVRFTSLGGWNRAVDKLESILAKIDALKKGDE